MAEVLLTLCTILTLTKEMVSAELNHINLKHWSNPTVHSAAMFVLLNCVSLVFILMEGELKCYNLTSGQVISHGAVIHQLGCGVALQGSNGIHWVNQSGQC